MQLFQKLFALVLIAALALNLQTAPAEAASSAAIRAYDNVDTSSKDFVGKNLRMAEFSDTHLDDVNFKNAQMQGVVFDNVTMTGSNFTNADLRDSMAYRSDFSRANFENAVLTEAILLKSTFTGAIAKNADFTDAALDKDQMLELCKTATGINPITKMDTRESLGCS